MKKPINLNPESARLSDFLGPKDRRICQCCESRIKVAGWVEHDHNDQKEYKIVFLCERCSKQLIEPHVRLYSQLWPNEPWPGAMEVCDDCIFRKGVYCINPKAKLNGGPGLKYDQAPPTRAIICGGPHAGPKLFFSEPVKQCDGKKK